MSDITIRNLGGIATGSLAEPIRRADSLSISDGRVEAIGTAGPARTTLDAGGAWALAGLWDGSFAIYFGDHEPTYSARGAIGAAVSFGVTTIVAGGTPLPAGWSADPRADRELAILTARSWRHDRPNGIKVATHAVRANPVWGAADFGALREAGITTLSVPLGLDDGPIRDLAANAREHGLEIGVVLDRRRAGAGTLVADLRPRFVLLESGDAGAVADAADLLSGVRALGLTLTAGPAALVRLVSAARERGLLDRVFLGTGLPGAPGVMPAGVGLVVELLVSAGVVSGPEAVALASGNVAAAYGLTGGRIEIGAPADLSIGEPPERSVHWATRRSRTMIDGVEAWTAPSEPMAPAGTGGRA